MTGAESLFHSVSLLQRGRYSRERRIELRAKALHRRDDGDRNASGDQPVFDCSHATFVVYKLPQQGSHVSPLSGLPRQDR